MLVARAQAGDERAYELLVRHNADRLYAVVLRFSATEADAEDATQEAFVRAWRSIRRFRGEARFFTWLYRIGVNEAKRIGERQHTPHDKAGIDDDTAGRVQDEAPDLHRHAEAVELRQILEQAIRRLPETVRAAVVLRDIEGLTTTEAAELLGLRQAAFKSRLHRGRMTLRAQLADHRFDGEDGR